MDWPDILRTILIGGASAGSVATLAWLLRRSRPLSLSGDSGTIRPDRVSAWLVVVLGAGTAAAGVMFLIYSHDYRWLGLALLVMGGLLTGFMSPSLTNVHAVNWNANGLEGPCKTFGPTLGLKRTSIGWKDVACSGMTSTQYWYVEANDGRRIYWSYLYRGYGVLTETLRRQCPSLALPDGM